MNPSRFLDAVDQLDPPGRSHAIAMAGAECARSSRCQGPPALCWSSIATRLPAAAGRLLAHLAADEPPENASLIARQFIADALGRKGGCRALTAEDLLVAPLDAEEGKPGPDFPSALRSTVAVCDSAGRTYTLTSVAGPTSIPQLRWCRTHPRPTALSRRSVSERLWPTSKAMSRCKLSRTGRLPMQERIPEFQRPCCGLSWRASREVRSCSIAGSERWCSQWLRGIV